MPHAPESYGRHMELKNSELKANVFFLVFNLSTISLHLSVPNVKVIPKYMKLGTVSRFIGCLYTGSLPNDALA
jgi:hypothetical protein